MSALALQNTQNNTTGQVFDATVPSDRTCQFSYIGGAIPDDQTSPSRHTLFSQSRPGQPSQIIFFGSSGNDVATGNGSPLGDHLYGAGGNDTLDGQAGNDYLEGGPGTDTYQFSANFGQDTILDSDGLGAITIAGTTLGGGKETAAGSGLWQSADRQYRYALVPEANGGQTLAIYTASASDRIVVGNFRNGQLGITLEGAPDIAPLNQDRTITGDLAPIDTDPLAAGVQTGSDELGNLRTDPERAEPGRADTLYDSAGNDLLRGLDGPDSLQAMRGGNDRLEAGGGNDHAVGGAGDDMLLGGAGADILAGEDGRDRLYGNLEVETALAITLGRGQGATRQKGDWLDGGTGDDILITGADDDALFGGAGEDLLVGGAGDDVLDGDDDYIAASVDWSITAADNGNIFDNGYSAVLSNNPATGLIGGADVLYGGAGNDRLYGLLGEDLLYGEDGNDILAGDDGNDILFGGAGNDKLAGDYGRVLYPTGVSVNPGDDYLDGGDGDDELYGEGGNDHLYGGAGADVLYGDSGTDAAQQGDDTLDGGNGDDRIHGGGGADALFGGQGHDVLQGGSGDDTLDGEAGDDDLDGGEGGDTLFGGAGQDNVRGGAGDDRLDGGSGHDSLAGGLGDDDLGGGAADAGDDLLEGGAGSDRYHFGFGAAHDTVRDEAGALDAIALAPGVTPSDLRLDYYASGWRMTLSDGSMLDIERPPLSNAYGAEPADDYPYGVERIEFTTGDGQAAIVWDLAAIVQRLGADAGIGTPGDDTLVAGAVPGGMAPQLYGLGGDDLLRAFVPGARLHGGAGNDVLSGERAYLHGGTGRDLLTGAAAVFNGGAGDDTIETTAVGNVYQIERGAGWDQIYTQAARSGAGPAQSHNDWLPRATRFGTLDTVRFGVGISPADLAVTVLDDYTSGDDVYYDPRTGAIREPNGATWANASELAIDLGNGDGVTIRFMPDAALAGGYAAYRYTNGKRSLDLDREWFWGAELDANDLGAQSFEFADGRHTTLDALLAHARGQPLEVFAAAVDGGGEAPNLPPLQNADLADAPVQAGEALRLTLADDVFIDPDGDPIEYRARQADDAPLPAWLVFDPLSRSFSGTPGPADAGVYRIRVDVGEAGKGIGAGGQIVAPGHAHALGDFTLLVTAGAAPTVSQDIDGQADALFQGTDADDRIEVDVDGAGTVHVAGGAGNDAIAVRGAAARVYYQFNPGDGHDTLDAPGVPDETVLFGAGVDPSQIRIAYNTRRYAGEQWADAVVSLDAADTASLTLRDGLYQGRIERFGFADGRILGFEQLAELAWSNAQGGGAPNHPPRTGLSLAAQLAQEDARWNFSLPPGSFSDPDAGDTLSLAASLVNGEGAAMPLAAWLSFDPLAGRFSGIPLNVDVGLLRLRVSATDAAGATVGADFDLTVANTNDAPVLRNPPAAGQAVENRLFVYVLPADVFADADALDVLTLRATLQGGTALPSWLAFDRLSATLSGTPPDGASGVLNIVIQATDSAGASASAALAIDIANSVVGGARADRLRGTGGPDLMFGLAGKDRLDAGGGNDTLDGGQGRDRMSGGAGSDTYMLGRGGGADTVHENDGDAGNTDIALFDAGIAAEQLWFRRVSSDLEVSIIGTADTLTIAGWYSGSQYHLEQFETSDGKTLLDSQVQNLVDAMAAFAPPAIGQTSLSAAYASQLNAVIAANWQ